MLFFLSAPVFIPHLASFFPLTPISLSTTGDLGQTPSPPKKKKRGGKKDLWSLSLSLSPPIDTVPPKLILIDWVTSHPPPHLTSHMHGVYHHNRVAPKKGGKSKIPRKGPYLFRFPFSFVGPPCLMWHSFLLSDRRPFFFPKRQFLRGKGKGEEEMLYIRGSQPMMGRDPKSGLRVGLHGENTLHLGRSSVKRF